MQAAVGRQIHARKTPVLQFRPDEVIRHAERIEQILRDAPRDSSPAAGPSADATATDRDAGNGSSAEADAGPA